MLKPLPAAPLLGEVDLSYKRPDLERLHRGTGREEGYIDVGVFAIIPLAAPLRRRE